MGFQLGMKGYIFYDLQSREISVTRNIVFFENTFPYNTTQSTMPPSPLITPQQPIFYDPFPNHVPHPPEYTQHIGPNTSPNQPILPSPNGPLPNIQPTTPNAPSTRIRKPPTHLKNYHCYNSSTGLLNESPQVVPILSHITLPMLIFLQPINNTL